jgi:hypothetical protein
MHDYIFIYVKWGRRQGRPEPERKRAAIWEILFHAFPENLERNEIISQT